MKRLLPIHMLMIFLIGGCMTNVKQQLTVGARSFDEGTIISGQTGESISFEAMLADLQTAQIIYVGEKHTHSVHHDIQLRIIKEMHRLNPDIRVGMEMFAQPYQTVLDEWSAGGMTEAAFLKQVHWYANWKYDFKLYREILFFIKEKEIPLIGLNVPFHLPPKISIGGIDTLFADEKNQLPKNIDTSIAAHREYLHDVFTQHNVRGRTDFENFYMAQCVWEDAMAEAVSRHVADSKMVVLAGNGHIYRKFGIPQRAYRRTGKPYKTLYPIVVGGDARLEDADYLWVTPESKNKFHRFN